MKRARRPRILAAAALASGMLVACTVEVALDGKTCPCVEGYLCDSIENVCVEDACAVSAKQLTSLWQTPHTLAFGWGPTGDGQKFLLYEMVVAESEQDLQTRAGTARVLTAAENPELGAFSPENGRPMLVMVDGLSPNTIYYAELVATDIDGCESRSGVKRTRTHAERTNDPIVLFDSWVEGQPLSLQPNAATVTGSGAAAQITYDVSTDTENCFFADARAECGQPLKLNLDVGIIGAESGQENRVRPDTFEDAYLEIVIHYESQVAARWTNTWLDTNGGPGDFRFGDFVLAGSSSFRTLEIPLRLLVQDGTTLQHENLLDEEVTQFGISAQWHRDAVVYLDAIRVRH